MEEILSNIRHNDFCPPPSVRPSATLTVMLSLDSIWGGLESSYQILISFNVKTRQKKEQTNILLIFKDLVLFSIFFYLYFFFLIFLCVCIFWKIYIYRTLTF